MGIDDTHDRDTPWRTTIHESERSSHGLILTKETGEGAVFHLPRNLMLDPDTCGVSIGPTDEGLDFEMPETVQASFPFVYQQLKAFYKQDPLARRSV